MADSENEAQDSLALELLRHALQDGVFTYAEITPLLRKLLPPAAAGRHSLYDLLCLLLQRDDPDSLALSQRLHARIIDKASKAAGARRESMEPSWHDTPELAHLPPELPVGWQADYPTLTVLQQAARLERDRAFLLTAAPDLSAVLRAISEACAEQREHVRRQPLRWSLLSPFPPEAPAGSDGGPPASAADPAPTGAQTRLAELADRVTAAAPDTDVPAALRQLVGWPDAEAAPFLIRVCDAAPAWQPYVMHALALRTGRRAMGWPEWETWLQSADAGSQELQDSVMRLAREYGAELELLRLHEESDAPDAAREAALTSACAEAARRTFQPGEFVRRWEHVLTPADGIRLEGATPPSVPPPPILLRAVPPMPAPAPGPAGSIAEPHRPLPPLGARGHRR